MTAFGDNVHGARSSQKTAVASCTLSLLLSASTSRSCLQKSKTLPEQGLLENRSQLRGSISPVTFHRHC